MVRGSWYRYDFSKDSEYLIVGFGSARMFEMKRNKGFEWDNTLKYRFKDFNFNYLLVGDVNNSWWQTKFEGLKGYGPPVVSRYLMRKIKESGATKTLYLGVSMGGYGAILFGCLTAATKVMAFSPQTYLSDRRRNHHLTKKFEPYDINETLTDLKQVLDERDKGRTAYHIWYGNRNNTDLGAAKRISHHLNVTLHPVDTPKHNPIIPVKKSGELNKEIESFLWGK